MAVGDRPQLNDMRRLVRGRIGKVALPVLLVVYLLFVWAPAVNLIHQGDKNTAAVRSEREQLLALIRVAHAIELAPQTSNKDVTNEIVNHAKELGVAVTRNQRQVIIQLKDVSHEDFMSLMTEAKVRSRMRLKAGRVHINQGGWQGEVTFAPGELENEP